MEHHLLTWHVACIPHHDIREDAVSEALFAVNLSRLSAESSITLALQEIGKRVVGLAVEDVRGES